MMSSWRLLTVVLGPVLLALACGSTSQAQPVWVRDATAKAPQITTHADAQALYLLDEESMRVGQGGRVDIHVRTAIKILKSSGASYAAFSELINPYREVHGLDGWLIGPDGKTRSLKKEYVIKHATNLAAGYYDDNMVMSAEFPDVSAGSIVAWEYNVTQSDPWGAVYGGFVFQMQEPVVTARFTLDIPEGWKFCFSALHLDSVAHSFQGNHHEWLMTNLPYRPTEPFMPKWRLVARRIVISCFDTKGADGNFADWPAAAKFVARVQDSLVEFGGPAGARATEITGGLATATEKWAAIAEYVRSNIRYVAVEINEGRLVPRAPDQTLANLYGDCKDKAALMRAMLKQVGIPSVAALAAVNTWVSPDLPTPFQFDHVIVAVPEAALGGQVYPGATVNGWVLFDPTDESTPVGSISATLSDSWILLGATLDSPLLKLPPLAPAKYQRHFTADATLTPTGDLTAQLRITDHGLLAHATMYEWRTTEAAAQVEEWRNYFSGSLAQPAVTEFVTNQDGDSAWITCTLTASQCLQTAGDFSLLKLDFFHDDVTATFKARTREHPIRFGSPMRVVTDVAWHLPAPLTVEGLIDSISAACPGCTYICRTAKTGDGVIYRSTHEVDGQMLQNSQYAAAQAFRKQFEKAQGLRIVLKK